MRVFRLCKQEYSATVMGGEGGLHADGRWHSAGRRVVYCASSEALSVLEVRVHVGRFLPKAPCAMHVIEIPDRLVRIASHDLPAGWNLVPQSRAGQHYGNAWLAERGSVALRVPSVHSRTDFNLLINPAHPSIDAARVVEVYSHSFDARLF